MTRRRYIQDRETGQLIEVSLDYSAPAPQSSMIMPDIQPYKSMLTGEMVTSRSHHRNLLKQHGVIEVGNETRYLKSKKPEPPPGLKETIIRAVKQHRGQ